MVASFGSMFVDIVQREFMHGPNGLPLGLLSLKLRFMELQYLTSSEFRLGIFSLSPRFKLFTYCSLVIVSTLISLFAGPATALLLIPDRHGTWPTGGASVWLTGGEDQLRPSRLSGSVNGGPRCSSPTPQKLTLEAVEYADCVWAGLSLIAERFKEAHYTGGADFSINDNVLRREYGIDSKVWSPETRVSAVHLATGLMLKSAGQIWFEALLSVPSSSKCHPLRWRSQGGTTGYAVGWAP